MKCPMAMTRHTWTGTGTGCRGKSTMLVLREPRVRRRVTSRAYSTETTTRQKPTTTPTPALGEFPWAESFNLFFSIQGARRAAQALEASVAVIGETVSSGESQLIINDAIGAIRQVMDSRDGSVNTPPAPSTSQTDETLQRLARIVRRYFEEMGGAYVKLGQFIASSPTLFPKQIIEEMQGCLDDVPPLSYKEEISKVIYKEMGGEAKVRDLFSDIDEKPLASASIAQVHRATLRSTGEKVVLKVVKPDVDKALKTDLDAVYLACRAIELIDSSISERLNLSMILSDARDAILAETDLVKEAQNMEMFKAFLQKTDPIFYDITVPRVYNDISTAKVLVMEELQGVPLSQYLDSSPSMRRSITNKSTESLIIEALNAWVGSVAMCKTFHADVHAGNLFVLYDGRLAFIDFGSVGKISIPTKRALEDLAEALPANDWDGAARALVSMGAIMGSDSEKYQVLRPLARDLEYLTDSVNLLVKDMVAMDVNVTATLGEGGGANIGNLDIAERANRLVLDVVDIAEKRGLRFPREFALLIKQMLYFDRFVQELAPELDVLTDDRVSKQLT